MTKSRPSDPLSRTLEIGSLTPPHISAGLRRKTGPKFQRPSTTLAQLFKLLVTLILTAGLMAKSKYRMALHVPGLRVECIRGIGAHLQTHARCLNFQNRSLDARTAATLWTKCWARLASLMTFHSLTRHGRRVLRAPIF